MFLGRRSVPMRAGCFLLSLVCLGTFTTGAWADNKDKLRQALGLPGFRICQGEPFVMVHEALEEVWLDIHDAELHNFIAFREDSKVPPRFSMEMHLRAGEIAAILEDLERHPKSADLYQALAVAQWDVDAEGLARRANARAIALYREQLQARPQDHATWRKLARALDFCPPWNLDEAEAAWRTVLKLEPNDWKCWLSLGDHLQTRLVVTLDETVEDIDTRLRLGNLNQRLPQNGGSPQLFEKALKIYRELQALYDRTVALAPKLADPHWKRAEFRIQWQTAFECELAMRAEKDVVQTRIRCLEAAVEDLRRARKLAAGPIDFGSRKSNLKGYCAVLEFLCQLQIARNRLGVAPPEEHLARLLPSFQEASPWLQKLAQSPSTRLAAGSNWVLGYLHLWQAIEKKDNKQAAARAEVYFRRCLALEPDCEGGRQFFYLTLKVQERPEAMVEWLEQEVKRKDTVSNRYWLAVALGEVKKFDQAEPHLRAVWKQYPNTIRSNVALAMVLMHRSDRSNTLPEAKAFLDRARAVTESPSSQDQYLLDLAQAAYLGLTGDRPAAESLLFSIREREPDDELVGVLLDAVAEACPLPELPRVTLPEAPPLPADSPAPEGD
jgi:tetratricopeptide (TPR) repeat protein